MRYIFENGNSSKDQQKNANNSKYTLWMNSILRRSKEIGKVESHPKFDGKQMIMVIQPL